MNYDLFGKSGLVDGFFLIVKCLKKMDLWIGLMDWFMILLNVYWISLVIFMGGN